MASLRQLVERLHVEADRFEEAAVPLLGVPRRGVGRRVRAFRRATAAKALAYAPDRDLPDFADRAVFSAGFATDSRDELWTRLAASHYWQK